MGSLKALYRRLYFHKIVCVFCSWIALTTLIIIMVAFDRRGSLSEYVNVPWGKEVFSYGFSLASVGFLTYRRFIPSFFLLMGIVHVTVYDHKTWHNLLSLGFFAYTALIMRLEGEKRLFAITLASAALVPFSLFWFEVVAITLIVVYTLKRSNNIL